MLQYNVSCYCFNFSDTLDVTAFQFSVITKGQAEWANRAVTEEQAREILQRYPEYNATIYDGDSPILDLLLTVKIDLIGSMAVTVVCMTLICSVFIHNQIGVLLVAATITSVCFCKFTSLYNYKYCCYIIL